ncbi:hypothetical protein V6x_21220 [Gimesia chilikensis]|uniref:2OG-Fe dioxygenase family protein n=1 Tax=Gimesia chilikensis TaxID=2605989 RepID=A0A517WAZ7_9PLAN|nr:2OG-Fe dioxygenase family protein [Gimesia chilikensis]QDU02419.1 hypothetical protein V6x_21220 [Gimesia chilikensis]
MRVIYSYFPGAAIETPGELNDEAVALLKEFDQLPPDPFAQQTLRHRRLGYFLALPWKGEIVPRPGSSYAQSAYHNPEDGGNQRTFESLTPAIASNGFLQALIRFDLRQIPFGAPNFPQAVDVGVHMVRMVATHDHPGISSPNCLHKDGEPYTFIHLIQREGVEGGESVVADNDRRELFRKTLTDALDTVVVDDRAVYHQITPITSNSAVRGGFRDVLLIDFTPLVRELTQ